MKLNKLNVGQFGKLKDREIELKDKLNIVYGPNEAGKSTLQTFIKSMFYGLSSKKKVDLKERHRVKPWNGDYPRGSLEFEDDQGNPIHIQRKFGLTPKADESVVYHGINGKKIHDVDQYEPGVDLFGVSEEGFERTLLINQLDSSIDSGSGEIELKLSNLHQTGDEGTSYRDAKTILIEGKKKITNDRSRVNRALLESSLDRLRELNEERNLLEQKQEENIEDEIELKVKRKQKTLIMSQIETKSKLKDQLKKYAVYKDYEILKAYEREIFEIKEELKRIESILSSNGQGVDDQFIAHLSKLYTELTQLEKIVEDLEEEKQEVEKRLNGNREAIERYESFDEFDSAIEEMLLDYKNRINYLSEKLQQVQVLKLQVQHFEEQIEEKNKALGDLVAFEKANQAIEEAIYAKKAQLEKLQQQQKDTGREEHLRFKRDLKQKSLKIRRIIFLVGVLSKVLSIILGTIVHPLIFLMLLITTTMSVFSLIGIIKVKRDITLLNNQLKECRKTSEQRDIEYKRMEKELKDIYDSFKVESIEDFHLKRNQYHQMMLVIHSLKVSLDHKKQELSAYDEEALTIELDVKKNFINHVLEKSNCASLEEFKTSLLQYKQLVTQRVAIEETYKGTIEKLEKQQTNVNDARLAILNELDFMSLSIQDIKELPGLILNLSEQLKMKRELLNQLAMKESLYKSKLNHREIELMESEIKDFHVEGIEANVDLERLESEIIVLNKQLKELEEIIRTIELRMEKRFFNMRPLTDVKEEVFDCEVRIAELYQQADTIDVTLEVLEDSFDDLQRSFGPELNQCVSKVLSYVTQGKYSEVIISEDFEIKIKDPELDELKEISYFSNGTLDLIYFCLRVALIELFYKEKQGVPLLLDDSFVQYDDERMKWALDYLLNHTENIQIILFTCHKREMEYLKFDERVNIIELEESVA